MPPHMRSARPDSASVPNTAITVLSTIIFNVQCDANLQAIPPARPVEPSMIEIPFPSGRYVPRGTHADFSKLHEPRRTTSNVHQHDG